MKSIPLLFALLGALLLFGCIGGNPPAASPTPAASIDATATPSPTPTIEPAITQAVEQAAETIPLGSSFSSLTG
ncbi:MAG: hypothetical protein Q8P02_05420, partial [Candidatus Micrarchaeota archaeon]|nr:hypothetical protein [Candidatus Micrarchaeota archaeon]